MDKSNNLKGSNRKIDINANVLKHIKEIPKIFWYPIAATIHTMFSLMQYLYIASLRILKKRRIEEEYSIRIIRKAVKSVLSSNSNVINNYNSRSINRIFTFMLEFISFLTTYVGFKFFLGNISPITPIFMAIVVQGGCYYLMNYTSSNKHSGVVRRNALLILLILTSMVTSYMGIFNGIISPNEYIENVYTDYQTTSNNLLADLITSKSFTTIEESKINKYFNNYKDIITEADLKVNNLSNANKFNTFVWESTHEGHKNYNNPELIKMKNEKKETIDNIKLYKDNLEKFTKDYNAKEVFNAYEQILNNINLLNEMDNTNSVVYNAFQKSIKSYNNLCKILENGDAPLDQLDIDKIYTDKQEQAALNNIKLASFDDLINGKKSTADTEEITEKKDADETNEKSTQNQILKSIKQFTSYLLPTTEVNSEEIRSKVKEAIENNYESLKHKLEENSEKLEEAYDKVDLPNTQVLPFFLPIRSVPDKNVEIIGAMFFSALIASIVDGLALMFSISLLNRRDSSLYYNNVDDFKRLREEIMEDCMMYNCLNDLHLNFLSQKDIDKNEINSVIVKKLNELMGGFMSKVHRCYFPTSFNSYGYICDDDLNRFNEAETNIFISLNNISMIKPFHKDELIAVLNHDFSKADNNNVISEQASEALIKKYEKKFKDDEVYYMVSKSVHVWFCDNFSELLENNLIFNADDKGQEGI